MHVFFSGIGGTGIGPLALIAHEAGFTVTGSDKQDSQYIHYLRSKGIDDIHIGQSRENIENAHSLNPIDWFVYSSAVAIENSSSPELNFCQDQAIKTSKRDELLNFIIQSNELKLIAVAGTHGKSTTTSMVIWLLKELNVPISYSVGAKISFGDMGEYKSNSEYFVYEADEFDRNFLSFEPYLSLISGVSWDHHEIFPTREDYQAAFNEFISQSQHTILWEEDNAYLGFAPASNITILESQNENISSIKLAGQYNRLDAFLALWAVHRLTKTPIDQLIDKINKFPGLNRRMEQIIPGLYSDYAHTPEKIRGAMSTILELAAPGQHNVVVIYEPLTNRRQHYIIDEYKDCFDGASAIYWLPSYLAREDPAQPVITPEELIAHLSDPALAIPMQKDDELKRKIIDHLKDGDFVVGISGGGGGSLDEWLRQVFVTA